MCGIVYAKSLVDKPVSKKVIKQYKDQKHRGSDGFGFYAPNENRLTHNTREGRILSLLRRNKSSEILMHHRFPTSTANRRNACHPFSTKDYFENQYVVVHNGVLYNEDALKKEHELLGIKYVSEQDNGRFNDSESLAYDVARYLEGEVDKITACGTIAFIAIKRDKEGNPVSLHFGRNLGNPLHIKMSKKNITISSEGDGDMVDADKVYTYVYATGELTYTDCVIPSYSSAGYGYQGSYGDYRGYTGGYDWDDDGVEDWGNPHNYDGYGNYTPRSRDSSIYLDNDDPSFGQQYDIKMGNRSAVKHIKDILMSEAYEDPFFALELGEEALSEKKEREIELIHLVNVLDTASDEDMEEYSRIDDEIWYFEQALLEIRKEVEAQSKAGFQEYINPRSSVPLLPAPATPAEATT